MSSVLKLPTDAAARKAAPIATGVIDYFPDAIVAVAMLSKIGNEQHNPGQPLHWDRSKSQDEDDALMRHFVERGTRDTDGVRHRTKVAWRSLAALQKEIEAEREGDTMLTGDGGSAVVTIAAGLHTRLDNCDCTQVTGCKRTPDRRCCNYGYRALDIAAGAAVERPTTTFTPHEIETTKCVHCGSGKLLHSIKGACLR